MNVFQVVVPVNGVFENLFANVASGWILLCVFAFVMSDSIVLAVGFESTYHAVVEAFIFSYPIPHEYI